MSIVLCFYDNKHHMVDSARLTTSDSPVVLREEFRKQGYRVGLTGNILAIHTDLPTENAMALAASYKGDVVSEVMAHAEIWCRLLGTDEKNHVIKRDGINVAVALHTLGGWSRRIVVGDNRAEVIKLKQWILEKAGLMIDSSRENDFLFDADLVEVGFRFLGHVACLEEVSQEWPPEARTHGNCWMSPRDVIICINGELSSFNRFEKPMLPVFTEMLKSAPVDTPAPVMVEEEAPKLTFEEWSTVYAEEYPELARNLDAMMRHVGHPDMQWLFQVNDVQLTIWVNGTGYITPLVNGISESVLGEIDADTTVENLEARHFMAQMFNFHYVTSYDYGLDMIPRAEHNRLDAIFSPTMVRIRTGAIEFDISRDLGVCDLYQILASKIPAGAFTYLMGCLTVACSQIDKYTVTLAGDMSELVQVTNQTNGVTATLPLMDFAAIVEYIEPTNPTPGEPSPDFSPETKVMLDAAIADTRATLNPQDEVLDLLDTALTATQQPKRLASATRKSLEQTIPESLREVLNKTRVIAEQPAVEEGDEIALPVVDIGDKYLYTMIFTFESAADCTLATDGGFAAALHLALGQTGAFEGRLVATNRIGRLPLIANEVSASMGIEGTVRCQRMTD